LAKIKKSLLNPAKLYFSGILAYGLGILIIRLLPYYQKTLSTITQKTILFFYILYMVISPLYFFFFAKENLNSKPYLALRGIFKIFSAFFKRKLAAVEKEEKVAYLFLLVKLFFLPIMVNFFFQNYSSLISNIKSFSWFPFLLTLIFFIDTFIFAAGYAVEFPFLGNMVRSVEPTFFGWFVALICYPPFNSVAGQYVPWGANDYAVFWGGTWTNIIRIIIVALLIIYVWATIALGFKSSNLTNRGIVSKFPYSVIRHPAYVSKSMVWWITLLPAISLTFAAGMLFWTAIYFFRAYTEERHLSQDKDYLEYCAKVKYRFIPFVL